MKNRISFTSVLKSKTELQSQNPKPYLVQQFNKTLESVASIKNSSSLAEIMNEFQQYPDEEYVLNFDGNSTSISSHHYTSQSDTSSVFDSKGSKGQSYANFDDWIASQARQQNKENIADVQPRLRNVNKGKGMLNFLSSKGSQYDSKQHQQKQSKKVVSSKNKIGLGKLCSMFDQNQIQDQEPVWKCQPNQSSQSLSSMNQYSKASQSRQSFADLAENFQPSLTKVDTKDFIKPKTKGLISSKAKSKQFQHKFTAEEEKDLKVKFAKIRSQEQSKIAKVQQTHLCSMKEQPKLLNINGGIKAKPLRQIDFETEKKQSQYSQSDGDYCVEQEQREIIRENTLKSIQEMAYEIVKKHSRNSNEQQDEEMLLTQKELSNKSSERSTPRVPILQSNNSIKAIDQMHQCLNTQERIKAVQNELSEIIKLKKTQTKKGNLQKVTFENFKQNRGYFTQQNRDYQSVENDQTHVPHFASPTYAENIIYSKNSSDEKQSQQQSQNQHQKKSKCQVGYSFAHQFNPLLSNGVKVSEYYKPNAQQIIQDSIKQSINNSKVVEEQKKQYSVQQSLDMNSRNFRKFNDVSNSKIPKIQSIDFSNYQANKFQYEHRRSQQIEQKLKFGSLNIKIQESIKFNNEEQVQDISEQQKEDQKMLGSKEKFILENSIPGQIRGSINIDDDTVVQEEQSQGIAIKKQQTTEERRHDRLTLQDLQCQQNTLLKQFNDETKKDDEAIQQKYIEQKIVSQEHLNPVLDGSSLKIDYAAEIFQPKQPIKKSESSEYIPPQNARQKISQIESIIIQSTKKQKKKLDEYIQKTVESECKPYCDYIQGQQSQVVSGAIRIPIYNNVALAKNPSTKMSIEFIDSDKKPNTQHLIQQQKKIEYLQKIAANKKQESKEFELQLSLNLAESSANLKSMNKNMIPTRQITIQKPIQAIKKQEKKTLVCLKQTPQTNNSRSFLKNQNLLRNSLLKKSGRLSNADSDFELQLQMDFDL